MASEVTSQFCILLDRDSIYDTLFDHLSPAGIFRTARTCRLARTAAVDYRTRAFDVHKHLRRFFADPLGFRILQAQTGAVISGSNALQFLDRDIYPESDMDIFVHTDSALQVCAWISESAGHGYSFVPNDEQASAGILTYKEAIGKFDDSQEESCSEDDFKWNRYDQSASFMVINFASSAGFVDTRQVQVIITGGLVTPMAKILSFHSTVVMNAITYSAAYSFFPQETFENRRLFEFGSRDPDDVQVSTTASVLDKYSARGWPKYRPEEPMPSECFLRTFGIGKRWVNDNRSWVIPFDIKGIEAHFAKERCAAASLGSIDPFSLNSFSVTYSGLGYSLSRPTDDILPTSVRLSADFDILNSAFFNKVYTICPELSVKLSQLFWHLHENLQDEPTLSIKPRCRLAIANIDRFVY